jgi:hypothetical protein
VLCPSHDGKRRFKEDAVEKIRKDDVIWIPAAVEHWHSAKYRDNAGGNTGTAQWKAIEWMEKATDEQYRK